MKPRFSFLILFVSILMLAGCRPSAKSAAQYNNRLIKYQLKVVDAQKELTDAINRGQNVEEMNSWLDKFKMQVKSGTDSISAVEEFDGRDDFKKVTLDYLGELNGLGENEYPELIRIYTIPDSMLTKEDEKKAQELFNAIRGKTDQAVKSLELVQEKFAREYNFEVRN